jgi:hypothetical protein
MTGKFFWFTKLSDGLFFNVYGSVHCNNILVYNSNKMHKSQSLFNLTTALHVSDVTITHLQEHKTTVTVRHPQHTQTGSKFSTIAADNSTV